MQPLDFAQIPGQAHAKRALEVAAAGGHPILLLGDVSLALQLASTLPTILPRPDHDGTPPLVIADPRDSDPELFGFYRDGAVHRGKVGDAHGGVFVANVGRMPRRQHAALGFVMARHQSVIRISRQRTFDNPAEFMLVGVASRCPCGAYDPIQERCWDCTPRQITQHRATILRSGLFQMVVTVGAPPVCEPATEGSLEVAPRVIGARAIQRERLVRSLIHRTNADFGPGDVQAFCGMDNPASLMMQAASRQLHLNVIDDHLTLKVARTIADLAGADMIGAIHLAEAIHDLPR